MARVTAVLALLAAVGFGLVLFEIDPERAHPAAHMGFFLALCVFLTALTGLLAQGARENLERRAADESPGRHDIHR